MISGKGVNKGELKKQSMVSCWWYLSAFIDLTYMHVEKM